MKQALRLTGEEQKILRHLTNDQLQLLGKLKKEEDFKILRDIANALIDVEKNIFFADDAAKFDPVVLYYKHAYAKGGAAKLVVLLHLIGGSEQEILYRENERKKRVEPKE